MSRLALIDYGSGNLRSAEKALVRAAGGRVEVRVTHAPEEVLAADRIVLPGVGAFAACRAALDARPGLGEALDEAVRVRGRPFLGICVGMQLMASRGLEFGVTPGLGWIPGEVRRLQPTDPSAKVPHMGWNDLIDPHGPGLIAGIGASPMYFTHSFAFWPDDTAAVVRGNMAGVQFHPEKSQSAGISLLSRFLEWRP
jgi:glutamine amidotransferase